MKTYFLFLVLSVFAFEGVAQVAIDTTSQLDSVTVLAKAIIPLGEPSRIESTKWQNGKLATSSSEALLYLPGVHIRQQGPGQITTLQYRGLQGARIAQTWQGLPVTNPQIGTGDVQELNLALVDQIEIGSPTYLGNAAAVSVTQTKGNIARFSTRYAEGNGLLINGQWDGFRFIYQNDENKFSHIGNNLWGESTKTKDPDIRVKSIGVSYTGNFSQNWSSSSYYLETVREYAQENFSDIGGPIFLNNELKTRTGRQLFSYKTDSGAETFDVGVLFDNLIFNREYYSTNEGQTIQPLVRYHVTGKNGLGFTTDNRILFSKHTNYEESIARLDSRSLISYSKSAKSLALDWAGGMHVRLNTGTIFFGSFSLIKKISTNEQFQFELKRIARFPSLDDQLWTSGGIEDLSPEEGWGISTSSKGKIGPIVVSPVVFARRFSKYILWIPRGIFWNPSSITNVNNYGAGLDISSQIGTKSKNITFLGSLNYSELKLAEDFQLSSRRIFLLNEHNLPFSPQFTGNLSVDYVHNKWSILAQGRYTGKQFTSYNALSEYDEFAVLRAAISHRAKLFNVGISCDNITNTIIPTDFGLFSPLRRFELTVNYTPNKTK